jgi:hypothetical protein
MQRITRLITAFTWIFCIAYLIVLSGQYAQAQTLTLAQSGTSSYIIVKADDAIPAETTAAEQFQKYFKDITGVQLVIQVESPSNANVPQILIGSGTRTKALLPNIDWNDMKPDQIVLKTVGNKVILAGDRPRGALYAVFEFLETQANCRWWTPTVNHIPTNNNFTINSIDVNYIPPFNDRSYYTPDPIADPIFATIMRQNGTHQTQSVAWGGHNSMLGFVHTHFLLLPPATYFAAHPEWYTDSTNNNMPCTAASPMPVAHSSQLDLSNPEVVQEAAKNAIKWIDTAPSNYTPSSRGSISISENDSGNYCNCAQCAALRTAEGSQSGPNLKFINEVAAIIKQKYPNFLVETLAYRGTVKVPTSIVPDDNVLIRMAPLQADFGHPMNSDWNGTTLPQYDNVRDNLPAWANISDHMFMWTYGTNFLNVLTPYPNWDGIAKDFKFYAANKVQGVFFQGNNYSNNVGDFVQMRDWVVSKLLWNPDQDQNALIVEYLDGYYGAAGPHLKKYLDLFQQVFLTSDLRLPANQDNYSYLTLGGMNAMTEVWEDAKQAVIGDPVLTERVRRERLAFDLIWLYRAKPLRQVADFLNGPFSGPANPLQLVNDTHTSLTALGVTEIYEGGSGSLAAEMDNLRQIHAVPVALPASVQALIPPGTESKNVIHLQQNDFELHRPGTWVTLVADPAASDGKAAREDINGFQWAIQYKLSNYGRDFLTNDQWRVFIYVRVKPQNPGVGNDVAFSAGFYDPKVQLVKTHLEKTMQDVGDNQYHEIDMGTHQFKHDDYFYMAPANNGYAEGIYLDRVILVRQ